MNDYNKKESSYHKYKDINNLYEWEMSQKLPVNDFKWIENISELNEDFIKSYNDKMKDIFLKSMFNIQKICISFIIIYPFCLKKWKLKKSESL